MLKREKEVFEALLTDEESVIKDLEKSFQRALQDIETKIKLLQADEMTQSKIYQIQYQRALKAQIEGIVEKLHGDNFTSIQQYLNECYTNAFVGTMYALHGQGMPVLAPIDQDAAVRAVMTDSKINEGLYEALGVDSKVLKKSIQREISVGLSSGATYAEITRNISFATGAPLSRAKTIVRTEGHRVQQASSADARDAAKAQGCSVVKQWDSTLDGKTRDTHRELDGQIRETDKPFESSSGRKARYPGDFGDPAEDCNCRCVALTRATWDLDESELKTLKDRAAFFGLDKTDSFKDFEKKYMKAAQTVEKSGKSGIIVPKADGVLDLETGVRYQLVKGSKLQDVEVFAGKGSKKEFRQAEKYAQRYGGNASDWQHAKGKGMLATDEGDVKAEIHWVQCEGIGKKEMFVKEWLE